MAPFNAACALSCDTCMVAAGDVIAAEDRRPSKYFIEPLIAVPYADVIGVNLSGVDPTHQVARNHAEWFWSWQ